MKLVVLENAKRAAGYAARLLADAVARHPQIVLGLATGGTMEPVYAHLRAAHRVGLSFAGVQSFNLDEYVGLSPDHPGSYHSYMRKHLFDAIDMDPARGHVPRGDAPDPVQEAARYEQAIAGAGGVDLQLLGIGKNGHIGFNEPPSDGASRCRVVTLAEETRRANAAYFPDGQTPLRAITMGVGTILDARACVLLATGATKAKAVAAMIDGPVTPDCPASALQRHPDVTVICDPAAAAELCETTLRETELRGA